MRLLAEAWRQRWPEILPDRPLAAAPPNWRRRARVETGHERIVPTLGDTVIALQLLEHALRPFSHPPVRADVMHAVTNGLGALPAVAAKWRYGMPMIVTEHGVYMREHYLHLRHPQFGWPVKDLYLRFLRRLCTLGYQEADVITPGNIYNKRWETELGADAARIRTVYNGVDPAAFPVLTEEPEVPTISWVGRIDPIKDLDHAAAGLLPGGQRRCRSARLRIFGSPPRGRRGLPGALPGRGRGPGPQRAGDLRGPGVGHHGRVRRGPSRRPLQHQRGLPLHAHRGDGLRAGHAWPPTSAGSARRSGTWPGWSCRPATRRPWRRPACGCCGMTTLRQDDGRRGPGAGHGALHRGPRDRRVRRDVHGSGLRPRPRLARRGGHRARRADRDHGRGHRRARRADRDLARGDRRGRRGRRAPRQPRRCGERQAA